MGDNNLHFCELTSNRPSVVRLWQQARAEFDDEELQLARYRELLEEFGHRNEGTAKW